MVLPNLHFRENLWLHCEELFEEIKNYERNANLEDIESPSQVCGYSYKVKFFLKIRKANLTVLNN